MVGQPQTTAEQERIERLQAALRQIREWCDAYPVTVFPEPALDDIRRQIGDGPFTALHGTWARRLLSGIRGIADEAMKDAGLDAAADASPASDDHANTEEGRR